MGEKMQQSIFQQNAFIRDSKIKKKKEKTKQQINTRKIWGYVREFPSVKTGNKIAGAVTARTEQPDQHSTAEQHHM